jgi:hypothetical protein
LTIVLILAVAYLGTNDCRVEEVEVCVPERADTVVRVDACS